MDVIGTPDLNRSSNPPSLEALRDEFARIRDGGDDDPGVQAHAAATLRSLDNPDFSAEMAAVVSHRRLVPVGNIARLAFHATHKDFLFEAVDLPHIQAITDRQERRDEILAALHNLGQGDYYENVTNPDFWEHKEAHIMEDPLRRAMFFYSDLLIRQNQANVPERYISSFLGGLLMQVIREKTTGEMTVHKLDVGCSANLGLVQEGLHIPFGDVEVGTLGEGDEYAETPLATQAINRLLRLPEHLTDSYGLDVINPDDDIHDIMWIVSNSFKPRELLPDSIRKAHFIELWRRKQESAVGFVQADYENMDGSDRHPALSQKYNMISFFTVLNQHPLAQRQEMLDQARSMLDTTGVILVQDFADVDPADPHKLQFSENWGNWQYRTLMYDTEKGWQEIFRWFNGRCGKVALGSGVITLGEHSLTPQELVAAV